jgi:hypothetical protein
LKKLLPYLFLFIVPSFLWSQPAGYMGKRFAISYSNYFFPGLRGPGPWNAGPSDESSFTINRANCLNAEYVLNDKRMICISGQFINTGLAYDRESRSEFFLTQHDAFPYPDQYRYTGNFSKPASLHSRNLSVGIKTFRKGFIAPVGRYRKIEVVLLFEKLRYDYHNFGERDPNAVNENDYIKKDYGAGEYNFRNIAFAYSFGYGRVLADKFVLDYGIRFAYCPALNIVNALSEGEFTTSAESYFRHESNLRIAKEQLINLHIGIGFLAF